MCAQAAACLHVNNISQDKINLRYGNFVNHMANHKYFPKIGLRPVSDNFCIISIFVILSKAVTSTVFAYLLVCIMI